MRDGPRGFGQGSSCPALLRVTPAADGHTRTGLSPATAHPSRWFRFARRRRTAALQPRRRRNATGLGCSPFARRYSGNRCCFLLLRVLRCFSSPGSPPGLTGIPRQRRGGLPHSDTRGSQGMCPSPRIFAACRVLLRLREPRHPPCALDRLPGARAPGGRSNLASLVDPHRIDILYSFTSTSYHQAKERRPDDPATVENNGFEPLTPCVQGRCSKPTELIPHFS